MQRIEKRGVVVYMSPQGESNMRVGLYTEEGMEYFTVYGARSNKGHLKSVLALFTMGRFIFNKVANNQLKFVDVNIYDRGEALAFNLDAYYAACTGAELIKVSIGADHKIQFKLFIDYLLFLINCPHCWKEALVFFLWKSLVYNGWQPNSSYIDMPLMDMQTKHIGELQEEKYVYYHSDKGFIEKNEEYIKEESLFIKYSIMEKLIKSDAQVFAQVCMDLCKVEEQELKKCMTILFNIWHNILGYKLKLSNFVQSYS